MPPLKTHQLMDATPELKKYLVRRLRRAPIDFESFGTRIKACSLEVCEGTCCYDGVCLDEEEEHYVGAIVEAHPHHFKPMGITRETAFEDATFLGDETRKTAVRKHKYSSHVGFPKHFDKTSCIFRHMDGRCSLQSLAYEHGEHPWAYKPLSCWLHPISLVRNDRAMLWLPTKETDHLADKGYPGYAPYTHCGREECKGGKPAYEILKPEIQALGEIVGRDYYGEIVAYFTKKKAASSANGSGSSKPATAKTKQSSTNGTRRARAGVK